MIVVPQLNHFDLQRIDRADFSSGEVGEVSFHVDVVPENVAERFVVGLLDETENRGIAVAVYPATGEVCDLTSGGGVIDYLCMAPLVPDEPVPCELKMYRFGCNFVCAVRIHGETFLYPAFTAETAPVISAFVGRERESLSAGLRYGGVRLDLSGTRPIAA